MANSPVQIELLLMCSNSANPLTVPATDSPSTIIVNNPNRSVRRDTENLGNVACVGVTNIGVTRSTRIPAIQSIYCIGPSTQMEAIQNRMSTLKPAQSGPANG
jgi:hypothetical protein